MTTPEQQAAIAAIIAEARELGHVITTGDRLEVLNDSL